MLTPSCDHAAAAVINRARPFAAIFSHCQPTVIVIGSATVGVVQVSTTSCPCRCVPAPPGMHVQTRPSASVTVRLLAICLPDEEIGNYFVSVMTTR